MKYNAWKHRNTLVIPLKDKFNEIQIIKYCNDYFRVSVTNGYDFLYCDRFFTNIFKLREYVKELKQGII
ncbi:MAG: hypothetical protein Unbinned8261contig1001_41 [Prokaryotic dsDNA virus sp.]|nr:MAG: hypothetical protein Unbinned8261contig1001_41 [Prokaryotic dsDNA virus sp.]|tara:strand:- start:3050 stop:3256 length:207 start_codon:yes stop_codon:yes gene_type:complete